MMTKAASVASPQQTPNVETQVDWSTKIAEVMREQFGLRPKQQSVMYKTPYPPAYNQIPVPHKCKMPDFTKLSGQGEVSTMEHVNRSLLQLGEAGNQDALRVRMFILVFIWIGICLVHHFASKLHIILGQSRETISSVLLLWDY